MRFFLRAPPLKLVYIGAEDVFKKILGLVGLKWMS